MFIARSRTHAQLDRYVVTRGEEYDETRVPAKIIQYSYSINNQTYFGQRQIGWDVDAKIYIYIFHSDAI